VATEVNFKRDKVAKGAIPQTIIGRKQQRSQDPHKIVAMGAIT